MTSKHKVFIYGTLRQEFSEPTHLIYDHGMYNYYDRFPYIIKEKGNDDWVVGNLLMVDDKELDHLDRYEGVDRGLYTREQVEVFSLKEDERSEGLAWVYVAGNIAPPRIESGNWHEREQL